MLTTRAFCLLVSLLFTAMLAFAAAQIQGGKYQLTVEK
jgi:hypothetical protein